MTVTAEQPIAGLGLNDLVSRTESLLQQGNDFAGWWVELATLLDAIGSRAVGLHDAAASRFAEQLRFDAPHLFECFRKLEEESDALSDQILKVRLATAESAGETKSVTDIPRQVRRVLRQLRRLESRSNSVMLEAYDRDIGGG